jgi:hypothetical protein
LPITGGKPDESIDQDALSSVFRMLMRAGTRTQRTLNPARMTVKTFYEDRAPLLLCCNSCSLVLLAAGRLLASGPETEKIKLASSTDPQAALELGRHGATFVTILSPG